jgi:hypothetical protein
LQQEGKNLLVERSFVANEHRPQESPRSSGHLHSDFSFEGKQASASSPARVEPYLFLYNPSRQGQQEPKETIEERQK